MHFLYTDESNLTPSDSADFFVYGGISIAHHRLRPLANAVADLRVRYGYRPGDLLKFDTAERPRHIPQDTHRDIKRDVITAAARHEVRLFLSFVLHRVASSSERARRFGIDTVCHRFHSYLERLDDDGQVCIDSFTEKHLRPIIREKFAVGLLVIPGRTPRPLPRILSFNVSIIGSSHYSSVVDIVLGAARWAVNSRKDSGSKLGTARALLGQLAPLCIRGEDGRVDQMSLSLSPRIIRWPPYLKEYEALRRFLARGGLEAAQERRRGHRVAVPTRESMRTHATDDSAAQGRLPAR